MTNSAFVGLGGVVIGATDVVIGATSSIAKKGPMTGNSARQLRTASTILTTKSLIIEQRPRLSAADVKVVAVVERPADVIVFDGTVLAKTEVPEETAVTVGTVIFKPH